MPTQQPLRPGTPEFIARQEAIARGQRPSSSNGLPGVQPPALDLSTSVAPPPSVQQWSAPTDADPRLTGLAGEFQTQQTGLSEGSDQDAVLALQRAKQLQAGQSRALGDQLAVEGGFGGARNQKLALLSASQQRDLASLNADLTSDARAKQLDVLKARAGVEGQIASERLSRGQLGVSGTSANNAANLGNWSQQQAATLAAQNLNLGAWQAAQSATAQQQMLALQASQQNNQNYWQAQALGLNPGTPPAPGGQPTTPQVPFNPRGGPAPRPMTYGR